MNNKIGKFTNSLINDSFTPIVFKNIFIKNQKQFEYTWGFNKQMLSAEINHEGIIETYTKQKNAQINVMAFKGRMKQVKSALEKFKKSIFFNFCNYLFIKLQIFIIFIF